MGRGGRAAGIGRLRLVAGVVAFAAVAAVRAAAPTGGAAVVIVHGVNLYRLIAPVVVFRLNFVVFLLDIRLWS